MTDSKAPTPGPLSGDDLKLLVKGDWLLPMLSGAQPKQLDHVGSTVRDTPLLFFVDGGSCLASVANFIGRPSADGWMPWPGGENPVGEMRDMEFRSRFGGTFINHARNVRWDHKGWETDIIAFRLAPTAPVEASGSELLPCPFCGGEAEIVHLDDGDNVGGSCVCCTKCQASGNVEFGRKENFVENWNRRAALRPQPSGETREAVDADIVEKLAHYLSPMDFQNFRRSSRNQHAANKAKTHYRKLAKRILKFRPIAEALIRPAPVASGGQHSSGEGRSAVAAIAAERQRQAEVEGWSEGHDDEHDDYQMARAAACYALSAGKYHSDGEFPFGGVAEAAIQHSWPWDRSWWKPKDRRSDLVRAGALIVAEIERLDRAALKSTTAQDGGES